MENLKVFVGKLVSLLVFNGALYALLTIIIYIVGVFFWQGLLSTLGLEYSFIRIDNYVFYIEGGFICFNSFYKVSIYICLTLYFIGTLLFLFSDFIYSILEWSKPKLQDENIKFRIKQFLLFLITLVLFIIVGLSIKVIAGSYTQGVSTAKEIIGKNDTQELNINEGKSEIIKQQIIKLKNRDVIKGKLIGCSEIQCIIYSDNKAFTIEKNSIESQITEFK